MLDEKEKQKALLRARGICVIIPTYNNGGTVADVVRRALAECADVIVVDDGSTDDTAVRLGSVGVFTLLRHDRNRGKGCALRTGFAKAEAMGFRYAITLDADGQHYPEDIPLFLEANRQHPHALIIGSRRMEGKEQGRGAAFANAFSNFWFFVQTGRRLPDTQTGYRLYPLKPHSSPPTAFTSRYEAELAMLVFASWRGTKLVPVSIDVYYPPAAERVSHFRPGPDFARISVLNTVLCFLAVVYGLPMRLCRWIAKIGRTVGSLLFFVFFSMFVFTPAVWLYVKFGRAGIANRGHRKQANIHRLIHWIARTLMYRIGIPGASFSCNERAGTGPAPTSAEGAEFDKQDSRVIICNHQSHLDLMCILTLSPKMVFLTNDWVWHSPFYGFIIRQAEYYPVSMGIDELMPRLRSLVERGYSIAVFPEGTRSVDCRIGRFHQGAFHIAEQLGLDVLPLCLYGPGIVLPKKAWTLRKSPMCMEVAPAICRAELDAMGDTMEQARTLRRRYKEWYDDLCNRME